MATVRIPNDDVSTDDETFAVDCESFLESESRGQGLDPDSEDNDDW